MSVYHLLHFIYYAIYEKDTVPAILVTCDQASLIFCRGGKVRLIQLLEYLSAAPQLKYLSAQMWAMPFPENQAELPEVLRVIDRSDRNPPITAVSVTFRPSLRQASGL